MPPWSGGGGGNTMGGGGIPDLQMDIHLTDDISLQR